MADLPRQSQILNLVIAVIAFLSSDANSQEVNNLESCLGRGGVTFEQRIAKCSEIILSPTEANESLALAYGNRAVAKSQMFEIESARQDYNEAIRLDPTSAASHRFRGNLHLFDGDDRKAAVEFRKATELDPKMGPAYANLGAIALRRGAVLSSIEYFNKAIALDPDNLPIFQLRGDAKLKAGSFEAAVADFNVAKNGPFPADAFRGRGSALAALGKHEQALPDFDEAIRLRSYAGDIYAHRCVTRAVLGQDYDSVVADCDRALSLMEDHAFVRMYRGFVFLKLGRAERALVEFNESLVLEPKRPHARYGRGLARLKTGDLEGGKKDIDSVNAMSSTPAKWVATYFRID